jgi:hypothetical protein
MARARYWPVLSAGAAVLTKMHGGSKGFSIPAGIEC